MIQNSGSMAAEPATDATVQQVRSELVGEMLTIEQVRAICAPPGRPAARGNVYRWIRDGLKISPTVRIKLAATRLPDGLCVRRLDLEKFLKDMRKAEKGTAHLRGRRSKPELAAAGSPVGSAT